MIMLVSPRTGEPLSFRGRVLLHDGPPAEVGFLLPTVRTVAVPGTSAARIAAHYGFPVMLLRRHPDMASVRWPLDRRDFRAR
jgi:hypothetical protein